MSALTSRVAAPSAEGHHAGSQGRCKLRAAVYRAYGPPEVVRIEDVQEPSVAEGEVLVRVRATTVCTPDWRFRKPEPQFIRLMNGLLRPKRVTVLGLELAGMIEKAGKSRFNAGDAVFGSTGFKFGAHAEYAAVSARLLAKKPDGVSFEEAAAIPFGGISALHFLRKANVRPGQHVLVYGASGSVGTAAVQLAKHFGARVTGVSSAANVELVKSLGADAVVDYTREDFSKAGRVYDMVFDTVGKSGFGRSLSVLKRGGCLAFAIAPPSWMARSLWAASTGAARILSGMARSRPGDMDFLAELAAAGKFRPVVGRRYPLAEIAEAHRHAESGHKRGNVVISVD